MADRWDALRGLVSARTLAHCRAVVDEAVRLSAVFGADARKLELAAALHDCAKDLPLASYVPLARELGIEPFEAELASPRVLHQRIGAAWATARFGVADPAVVAAIACHTTGRAEMDALARCLMVADYVSPDRDYAGVEELRRASEQGAEAGFAAVLAFKRSMVAARGLAEHLWAKEAYARWLGSRG